MTYRKNRAEALSAGRAKRKATKYAANFSLQTMFAKKYLDQRITKLISLNFQCRIFSSKCIEMKKSVKLKNLLLFRFSLIIKCSFSSKDEPLRFLNDINLYHKLCEQIKIGSNVNEVLPLQLAYIPFGTINHRKEKYFVDLILSRWWNLLENNLPNVHGVNLVSTIFNLQKIDNARVGDVFNFLRWSGIGRIVEFALTDVKLKRFDAK